ncbi:MAG: phosphodiesterase [Pseudomonadota bacterium]
MNLIAQISDTHIRLPGQLIEGKIDTLAYLSVCIDRINALPQKPDLVIASGDLADTGSAAEYRRIKWELDRLTIPYCVMPGNHDLRASMREVFGSTPALPVSGNGHLQYAVELEEIRILCLDSLDEGKEGGWLCADRLDWLHDELAASAKPAMIFLHHPPFDCGILGMDAIKLGNPERLAEVLAEHDHVIGLSCGHVHRSVFTQWAGLPACICPSPAHQIHLDTNENAPLSWTLEAGGFLLHRIRDGTFVAHVVNGPSPTATPYT